MGLTLVKPTSKAEKRTRSTVDTITFTREQCNEWVRPPFQRPLRINAKVRHLAEEIADDGGVLPGIITFGIVGSTRYLIDGQHRKEAFLLSEAPVGYADARTVCFGSLPELGQEFVNLNSCLVRMRPDDILRGLEGALPILKAIRDACPFVGYDQIRRGTSGPILSMSQALRVWNNSAAEVPLICGTAKTASEAANDLSAESAAEMIAFFQLMQEAWGRDLEYAKLWGAFSLMLCAWLYRRMVLGHGADKTKRWTTIRPEQFRACAMSLSAGGYITWLEGRGKDRDRAPGYKRIKALMATRYAKDTGKRLVFPAPTWAA